MKEDEQDVLHVCKWGQNGIILEITKKKERLRHEKLPLLYSYSIK